MNLISILTIAFLLAVGLFMIKCAYTKYLLGAVKEEIAEFRADVLETKGAKEWYKISVDETYLRGFWILVLNPFTLKKKHCFKKGLFKAYIDERNNI